MSAFSTTGPETAAVRYTELVGSQREARRGCSTGKNMLGPWSSPLPVETRLLRAFLVFYEGRYYIFSPAWSGRPMILNFDNAFLTVLTDEDGTQRAAIEVVQDEIGQFYIAAAVVPESIWAS
jgi:hypothetical protein